MAGRKASTLCSPATLSQCARVSPKSRLPCWAPPSGNTGSDAILCVAKVVYRNPFTAILAFFFTEQICYLDIQL